MLISISATKKEQVIQVIVYLFWTLWGWIGPRRDKLGLALSSYHLMAASSGQKKLSFCLSISCQLGRVQTQGHFCVKFYLLTPVPTLPLAVGNQHLEFLGFTSCRYSTDSQFSPNVQFIPVNIIRLWHVHSVLVLPSFSTSVMLELQASSWTELAWSPGDFLALASVINTADLPTKITTSNLWSLTA